MVVSSRKSRLIWFVALLLWVEFHGQFAEAQSPHNLILFIPDGLRLESVAPANAPTFARVRDQGVRFTNTHSVFPTLTMVNSSAMGTGHFPGDTGKRRDPGRDQRALRRQLSERGNPAGGRAQGRVSHRRCRQSRARGDLRCDGTERRADDRDRRSHRAAGRIAFERARPRRAANRAVAQSGAAQRR